VALAEVDSVAFSESTVALFSAGVVCSVAAAGVLSAAVVLSVSVFALMGKRMNNDKAKKSFFKVITPNNLSIFRNIIVT
jgi:hypothetical protein